MMVMVPRRSTVRPRRSKYNIENALNYARLAFKAACHDQERAEIAIAEIFSAHGDSRERIRRLAYVLAARIEESQERAA